MAVAIIFAMLAAVAPMVGGVTVMAAEAPNSVLIPASQNITHLARAGHWPNMSSIGEGDHDTLGLDFRHTTFLQFNASDFIGQADNIESAYVRVHIIDWTNWQNNPMATNTFRYNPHFFFDAWGSAGTIWTENHVNGEVWDGWNHVTDVPVLPYDGSVNASNSMFASINALSTRGEGSLVASFMVDRTIRDKFYYVNVTDFVRSSVNPTGSPVSGTTGTGLGRNGIINLGWRVSTWGHWQANDITGAEWSARGNSNGNGPQLIINLRNDGIETQDPIFATASAMLAPAETNPTVTGGHLTVSAIHPYQMTFTDSFVQFPVSEIYIPEGHEIYDITLRMTTINLAGNSPHRLIAASLAGDNWDLATMTFANGNPTLSRYLVTDRSYDAGSVVPGILDTALNPAANSAVYFNVTRAYTDYLNIGGNPDYLSFRLNTIGAWTHTSTINLHSSNSDTTSARPQLIVRTVPIPQDGFVSVTVEDFGLGNITVTGQNNSDVAISAILVVPMFDGPRFVGFYNYGTVTIPINYGDGWEYTAVITDITSGADSMTPFLWYGIGSMQAVRLVNAN